MHTLINIVSGVYMQPITLKVMTVTISKKIASDFSKLLDDLNLRRDAYLAKQLPNEIDHLAKLPALSEDMATYLRYMGQHKKSERTKIGLKLPEKIVEGINAICREKGIQRDLFIETFINFLVNGRKDTGNSFTDTASPLRAAKEYLDDPYCDTDGNVNIYRENILASSFSSIAATDFQEWFSKGTSKDVKENNHGK